MISPSRENLEPPWPSIFVSLITCSLLPSILAIRLSHPLLLSSLWTPPARLFMASPSEFFCLRCLNANQTAEASHVLKKEQEPVKQTDIGVVPMAYRFLCWISVIAILFQPNKSPTRCASPFHFTDDETEAHGEVTYPNGLWRLWAFYYNMLLWTWANI